MKRLRLACARAEEHPEKHVGRIVSRSSSIHSLIIILGDRYCNNWGATTLSREPAQPRAAPRPRQDVCAAFKGRKHHHATSSTGDRSFDPPFEPVAAVLKKRSEFSHRTWADRRRLRDGKRRCSFWPRGLCPKSSATRARPANEVCGTWDAGSTQYAPAVPWDLSSSVAAVLVPPPQCYHFARVEARWTL